MQNQSKALVSATTKAAAVVSKDFSVTLTREAYHLAPQKAVGIRDKVVNRIKHARESLRKKGGHVGRSDLALVIAELDCTIPSAFTKGGRTAIVSCEVVPRPEACRGENGAVSNVNTHYALVKVVVSNKNDEVDHQYENRYWLGTEARTS